MRGLVEANQTRGVAERALFAIALHDDEARVGPILENFVRSSALDNVRAKAVFWLAQVVRESATSFDIGRLQVARDRLDSRAQDLRSDLSRLGSEPAIRKLSLNAGLGQLDDPIVLVAR